MTRLQTYSYRVALICRLFLVLLPIGIIYSWLSVQTPYDYLSMTGVAPFDMNIHELTQTPLSMQTRVISIIVSLAYSLILISALNYLITLFKNYQKGDIFTLQNTKLYQKLGYSVFYWVIGGVIYHAVMTVVLSFNNPPGQRVLAIGVSGIDILGLLIGFLIVMISWVMQEGYRIADENTHTI
ncbi:DUF2975 domain-containing protein [Shewanella marina]|uniref:DUF2975 domain-containing protein n=1 Tax=Shewanella marina TaxID=487319 RepID=UPI000472D542|nr:DUF2975 domain-containing protein [Shewanella marina]